MRRLILSVFAVLATATTARLASCQIGSATEAAARELIEVMLRQGGREAAAELAAMGGEAAVREVLERATGEGGEALAQRVAQYGTRYGPAALKAVERSPSRMVQALDGLPPDFIQPAIRAAAREPELTSRLVAAYGKDALEVAARHPGVGAGLAEKLGAEGITVGRKLTTDQAVMLARYADDIAALPSGERNQVLEAIMKAPAAVLDYLEAHPKVLLTAGGVAAVLAAKDNLFGSATSSANPDSPPPSLVERVIFGVGDRLAVPVKVVVVIIIVGVFVYVAILSRSVWRSKAVRLRMESRALSKIEANRRRRYSR